MKRKTLVKWLLALGGAALVIALFVAFGPNSKFSAARYVQSHQEELTAYAETIQAEKSQDSYNGWAVDYFPTGGGVVQFTVSAGGIVPSSTYKGFYYSPKDKPLGFQATSVELTPSGSGWSWSEEGGDNTLYTEKLADNWYWFEAKF
jgi:hypothetical protein